MGKPVIITKGQKSHKLFIIVAISLVLIALSGTAFLLSYEKMKDTIALERETYVSELTLQVVEKVNATINKKLDEAASYANLVNQVSPDSFLKMDELFRTTSAANKGDKILLLSQQGSVYLTDGTTIRVSDPAFLSYIGSKGQVTSTFSPLGNLGDYWLFGSPITPITVDGIPMVAIIRANKNATFSDEMTVSMFEQNTNSFLIGDNANILIKPDSSKDYGSNLMHSLSADGLDDADNDAITENIKNHQAQSVFFTLDGEQWLIQTAYVRDSYSVALLLPIQITSSETIKAMNQTMLMVVVLLLIAMASVFIVLIITMRSRNEKRMQEEAFKTALMLKSAQNKTDFLSKMSHDIRTPLNGIIGMTILAADNMDNPPALENNLSKIKSSADYLLSLVNDILDMSKIDSGKMTLHLNVANAEDLLSNAVDRFEIQAREQQLTLILKGTDPTPHSYLVDKLRVNQVLMNLLSNAIKFTPSHGKIEASLTVLPLDDKTDSVIFRIADTGVGMTEEFMDRIFTAFEQESETTTQKYGGSGLGLSIVKKLVDLMGGSVSVESQVNEGSTFTVILPLQITEKCQEEKLVQTAENLTPTSDAPFAGKRVLLLEDHPINAEIATRILEKWGLEITLAENGQIGVNAFTASAPGYYSLVFMDIKMPVMDGFEATRAMRESAHPDAKTIPIYAMSANAFEDDVQKSLDAGMNGHLRKPIELAALRAVIIDNLLETTT